MKRLLLTLALMVAVAPVALAGDFDYGQTSDGYYCYNQSCNLVYAKDASLIGDYGYRDSLGSSLWYMERAMQNNHQLRHIITKKYWERIEKMKELNQ